MLDELRVQICPVLVGPADLLCILGFEVGGGR